MFQFGALDPRVGNDRRNQLLQQLMQQFMQNQGAGAGGQALPPASRPFSAVRPMLGTAAARNPFARQGTTATAHPMNIPGFVNDQLGPGGSERMNNDMATRAQAEGAPVPGFTRAPIPPLPPNMGAPIPGLGGPHIPPPPSAPTPGLVNSVPGQGSTPTAAPPSSAGSPVPIGAGGGVLTGSHPWSWSPPAAGLTTPGGSIPLGNGIFIDPTTGMVHGVSTPASGTAVRLFGRMGVA